MTISNKNYEILSYSDIHELLTKEIQYTIKGGRIDFKQIPNEGGKYDYYMETVFMVTGAKQAIQVDNKNNYKFHIAIDDAKNTGGEIDPNLQHGYDIASKILQENNVYKYKVELPGIKLEAFDPTQARKQITVYSGDEGNSRKLEQWTEIMDDIVLSFVDNEVRPKPEFNGEQDVRVKGSNYITYRNDDAGRGIGKQYVRSGSYDDPLKDMRLSDILYAQLLALANSKEELTQKKIQSAINYNLRYTGIKKDNLVRIWQHIEDKKPIKDIAKAVMIQKTLAITWNNLSDDISDNINTIVPDTINKYETTTKFSKAAAEYNQLILDVVKEISYKNMEDILEGESLPETEDMPEWWNLNCKNEEALMVALRWSKQNSQWDKAIGYNREDLKQTIGPGMHVLSSKAFEIEALISAEAIAAYKTKEVCLADLAIFNANKIKALVSPEAVEAYTQGKFTVKNLAQYTADEIKDKIKQEAAYKPGKV